MRNPTAEEANCLVVIVTLRIGSEYRDEFRQALLNNARESLVCEQGCLVFDVSEHATDPEFFLYEVYANAAAFEAHLATAHFKEFNGLTTAWVLEKRVARYTRVGVSIS